MCVCVCVCACVGMCVHAHAHTRVCVFIPPMNRTHVQGAITPGTNKKKGCIDIHAPLRKLRKKEIKLKNKPWVTYILKFIIDLKILLIKI